MLKFTGKDIKIVIIITFHIFLKVKQRHKRHKKALKSTTRDKTYNVWEKYILDGISDILNITKHYFIVNYKI